MHSRIDRCCNNVTRTGELNAVIASYGVIDCRKLLALVSWLEEKDVLKSCYHIESKKKRFCLRWYGAWNWCYDLLFFSRRGTETWFFATEDRVNAEYDPSPEKLNCYEIKNQQLKKSIFGINAAMKAMNTCLLGMNIKVATNKTEKAILEKSNKVLHVSAD